MSDLKPVEVVDDTSSDDIHTSDIDEELLKQDEKNLEIKKEVPVKTYCIKCKVKTDSGECQFFRSKNLVNIKKSKCVKCGIWKTSFIKNNSDVPADKIVKNSVLRTKSKKEITEETYKYRELKLECYEKLDANPNMPAEEQKIVRNIISDLNKKIEELNKEISKVDDAKYEKRIRIS